jgi:hypothetical protein
MGCNMGPWCLPDCWATMRSRLHVRTTLAPPAAIRVASATSCPERSPALGNGRSRRCAAGLIGLAGSLCSSSQRRGAATEPTLEDEDGAIASISELAVEEHSLPGSQLAVRWHGMVRRPLPAGTQPKTAETRDDRVIGAAEQHRQQRWVESGMQAKELIVLGGPSRSGPGALRWRVRVKPEPARPAADRLGRAPEHSGGVVDRVERQRVGEARLVPGAPVTGVARETELVGPSRDRCWRALNQGSSDLVACEAVGVAVAQRRVLGVRPSPASFWAVESEAPGTEKQRLRAAAKLAREVIEASSRCPCRTKRRVVVRRISARGRSSEPEPSPARSNLLNGSAHASCELGRRHACPSRLPKHRIPQRRPLAGSPAGAETKLRPARADRVLRPTECARDHRQRRAGGIQLAEPSVLVGAPASRHVNADLTSCAGAIVKQANHDAEHGARDREVDRHDRDQDPPAVDAADEADQGDDQQRRGREYG